MKKKNIAMLVFIAVATGTAIVIKKTIDNKSTEKDVNLGDLALT